MHDGLRRAQVRLPEHAQRRTLALHQMYVPVGGGGSNRNLIVMKMLIQIFSQKIRTVK